MNYIYKITCIPNGRVYVGQHVWKGEGLDPKYFGSSCNSNFYIDLTLYPKSTCWTIEILEVVTDASQIADRETYWISQWFDGGKMCYNLNPQGGGGWGPCNASLTFEQRQIISKLGNDAQKKLGVGFYGMTHEECSFYGSLAVEVNKAQGTALYDPAIQALGLETQRQNKDGFFNHDNVMKANQASLDVQRQNQTGIFSPDHWIQKYSLEVQKAEGTGLYDPLTRQKSVATNKENKTGMFAPGFAQVGLKAQEEQRKGIVYDPIAKAKGCKTRNRVFVWSLNGDVVYIGRNCDAKRMMKYHNQVWDQSEDPIPEELLTNKEWFESHRTWYHPSLQTLMTNGQEVLTCNAVNHRFLKGKTTWTDWTLVEFTS